MSLQCHLDSRSAAIAAAFNADSGPDPWEGGALIEQRFGPVVVRSGSSGRRFIRPMHWGYPAAGQSTELTPPGGLRWVFHVRNFDSPFWIGNLRHAGLRCLIPMTSFHYRSRRHGAPMLNCTLPDRPIFAVAGIWRDLTDMPVFAMLVTEPSSALIPVEGGKAPVSMPAILPAGSEERWLCADWKEAQQLIRPIAGAELVVEELSGAGPDFRSPSR